MKKLAVLIVTLVSAAFAAAQDEQKVVINFQGVVGNEVFSCDQTYKDIGTSRSTMTVSDFRFFVEDVRLVDKKGKETSVKLSDDGKYQSDKVALIDLENGEGPCKNGTPDLNTSIRGEVPKGKYVGVRFRIGVPEELNHLDPTQQPSPLNITRMMWSWQAGYKFVRIDTKTTGEPSGYVLHLGSTECSNDPATGKTTCKIENRPEFSFPKFDLNKDVLKVDLKSLFARSNVDINQEKTAAGCMSFAGDSDCKGIFETLGLPFDGTSQKAQSFIRPAKAPKTPLHPVVSSTNAGAK